MSDQQHVNSVHDSNRLPAWLAVHFPVLSRQMMRIVKDQAGRFETDAVLSLVDPVFSFVPGKIPRGTCVDEYVYTITRLSTDVHTLSTIECGYSAARTNTRIGRDQIETLACTWVSENLTPRFSYSEARRT